VAAFAASLSSLGDVYVNDAFGTAHRAHASMVGCQLPQRCSGFLLKKELDYFSKALEQPRKPYVAILGGAKVADKIQLIRNLLPLVDEMIIGGGMAFTFAKVLDQHQIGASLFDAEGAKIVGELAALAAKHNVKLHRPSTTLSPTSSPPTPLTRSSPLPTACPRAGSASTSVRRRSSSLPTCLARAQTVVWNGPMGVFEFPAFATGTKSLLDAAAKATAAGATVIIGGGDTATAAADFGVEDKVSHVSTGGGASLELLEGKELPGVTALSSA
jgi:phosphoglycerate kinase